VRLLLSDPVPLRTARMLGNYRDDAFLALVYGDLSEARFPTVRLADDRFLVADHPMEITAAYVGDRLTTGWQQAIGSDGEGHAWTELRLAAKAPPEATVSAAGRGKRNGKTNELITNPADVVQDFLAICGRDEDWSALRAEASRLGLRVAGRIAEALVIRAQLDEILQSVGVIWTQGVARVYPTSETPVPVLDLDRSEAENIEVSASLADVADILRIAYDRCDATGRMQKHIELTASPQRFGGLVKEVSYPWLRTPANAETVGRPVLSRLAGEQYSVTFDSRRSSIRPGMWVRPIAHPEWPLEGDDPVIMALGVELEGTAASVRVSGETLRSPPAITVTSHSVAVPDTLGAQIDVAFVHGVATLTITDTDGRPVVDAFVALDGGPPKRTDAQGQVSFVAKAGEHVLAVSAEGKQSVALGIFL
jgi:hypothetical protein